MFLLGLSSDSKLCSFLWHSDFSWSLLREKALFLLVTQCFCLVSPQRVSLAPSCDSMFPWSHTRYLLNKWLTVLIDWLWVNGWVNLLTLVMCHIASFVPSCDSIFCFLSPQTVSFVPCHTKFLLGLSDSKLCSFLWHSVFSWSLLREQAWPLLVTVFCLVSHQLSVE